MAALCLFLVAACGYDYKNNKIPNYLIVLTVAFGAGCRLYGEGPPGILSYFEEVILTMAILYPFFKIGALGAGDVKLLGVTAGYLPFKKIFVFVFISLLIAAMISLVKMLKRSNFVERMKYLFGYLTDVVRSGNWKLYLENEEDKQGVGICFSGPVLFSILLYLGGAY